MEMLEKESDVEFGGKQTVSGIGNYFNVCYLPDADSYITIANSTYTQNFIDITTDFKHSSNPNLSINTFFYKNEIHNVNQLKNIIDLKNSGAISNISFKDSSGNNTNSVNFVANNFGHNETSEGISNLTYPYKFIDFDWFKDSQGNQIFINEWFTSVLQFTPNFGNHEYHVRVNTLAEFQKALDLPKTSNPNTNSNNFESVATHIILVRTIN